MGACDHESAACKQDRKDYDDAKYDRNTETQAITTISEAISNLKGVLAGGAAGVVGGAAISGTAVGAVVGVPIAIFGGLTALGALWGIHNLNNELADHRAKCQACRDRMKQAHDKALRDCENGDCVPSADIPACP